MRENDVLLVTISKVVIVIILTFGFYIFFSGHNGPGGGFIGGLVFTSAFILMFLAFDAEKIRQSLPFDFRYLIVGGSVISLSTLFLPLFLGDEWLTQYDEYYQLPGVGEIHFTTVTVFEFGILLTVLGVVMTILLTISGDQK
ncbi:Na(+)/H(+) antiporter subunit B [Macrococcus brunensis]|uniref:Na(+)/H(+) antiporter subunit B n=1 Tax=Macrococcus brunensis TaxID=198483 RepID=A0A4R6BDG3_9STAP|nr:MnhB domain-containing protein [Macrococcus brunensis]TDL97723.1 Na(+)/H(+) antiporter subunit B [Macrococcus brunensis]ULG72875.1 Na(+)/H(+) antiporter subunit B [Macrococcus brunensis]ULG75123.1 Na(+)/H(+) antiporter subunit B [Macrococcus brunensis]